MKLEFFREQETRVITDYAINSNISKEIFKCSQNKIETSYFIGVDWLEDNLAIYVAPKMNEEAHQTNYLKMLFDALKHPEVLAHTNKLFKINFDDKPIEIEQKQDLLTPLLVVHFLGIIEKIVKKGLKKSYYKVEKNLTAKVKGKILINQTIKKNIVKNDILKTYCSYDEFGFNSLENRLIKKTLLFIQRYLPIIPHIEKNNSFIINSFNYILPAFENVSEEIELYEIKNSKFNVFYTEYNEATRLAKIILKRFGYNINQTTEQIKIKTPPFWIDMAKLFELYVLGLLKDRFKNSVYYHFRTTGNELDFLLNTNEYKMIIDAKYKQKYQKGFFKEDVRQLSGYARLKKVYKELQKPENETIDCLIIYPKKDGLDSLENCHLYSEEIKAYVKFYKLGVKIPIIQ